MRFEDRTVARLQVADLGFDQVGTGLVRNGGSAFDDGASPVLQAQAAANWAGAP